MKKAVLVFIVFLSACDYYDNSLKIINKSHIQVAVEESIHKDSVSFNNMEYYLSNIVQPDSVKDLLISGKVGAWRRHVHNGPQKKIFIYVFAVDTLKKYQGKKTMYDLFNQQKYIKMYTLSEKQLDDLHWKVQFR